MKFSIWCSYTIWHNLVPFFLKNPSTQLHLDKKSKTLFVKKNTLTKHTSFLVEQQQKNQSQLTMQFHNVACCFTHMCSVYFCKVLTLVYTGFQMCKMLAHIIDMLTVCIKCYVCNPPRAETICSQLFRRVPGVRVRWKLLLLS